MLTRSEFAKLVSAIVATGIVSVAYAFRSDATVASVLLGIAGVVVGKEFLRQTGAK